MGFLSSNRARSRLWVRDQESALVAFIAMTLIGATLSGCGFKTPVGNSSFESSEKKDTSHPTDDASAAVSSSDPFAEELVKIIGSSCNRSGADESEQADAATRVMTVKANAYWTSSGLYMHRGEKAQVEANGTWTMWKDVNPNVDANGDSSFGAFEGCAKGALVARIGLPYGGDRQCIGTTGRITADRDGILYFGMNDSGAALFHDGVLTVAVQAPSPMLSAPTILAGASGSYDYCSVESKWAELLSPKYVTLTVPVALAAANAATLPETLTYYDAIYNQLSLVVGATPYGGGRIRFVPDFEVRQAGWMLAGNPILYDPKNLNAVSPSQAKVLDPFNSKSFEFVRAMAVGFSRSKGSAYQAGENAVEAWGGLLAIIALEVAASAGSLKALPDLPQEPCAGRASYLAGGKADAFYADSWLQLCFLTEFKDRYGWEFYERFFKDLPAAGDPAWSDLFPVGLSPASSWLRLLPLFDAAAGSSTADLFQKYFLGG